MRVLSLVSALVVATPAAACLPSEAALEGALWRVEATHPAGHAMGGWVLVLPEAACARVEDPLEGMVEREIRLVHLVPAADGMAAPAAFAEGARARGRMIARHTAWHLGEAVMVDAVIEPIGEFSAP